MVVSNRNGQDRADVMEECAETNKRVLERCGAGNLHATPSKVHIMKKVHPDQVEDISDADILKAIYSLGRRFDKQEKK